MNTKQLQYVITLAHEGSFSRAADVLNITQPSLSQYIKKIEKQIGLELFDRTNGDVRLTDAGHVYIDTGRKILDLEHRMENSFTDLAAYKTGSLIIGAAPYRAASMLPTIVRSFQSLHPGMHLVVREGTTAELVEGMEHGEYDLALTLLPIDGRLFTWEKVMEEELVLAVPQSFSHIPTTTVPGKKYGAIKVEELDRKPLVMLTESQYMQKQLNNLVIEYKITVHPAAIVKSLEAQIEFVKAGVGMALVPSGIERFCTDSSVTFYSFIPELPKREVVVMW
ncbi:MAG: LysR family transcriptional regulator, partial [Lachnospiraceae bacterium]|nr:LysR family transcriptional regulator [Lachnospiraceae bacterium]